MIADPPDPCAAAEGQRLYEQWNRRLNSGELENAPVTAYALARPGLADLADVMAAGGALLAELYADPRHVAGLAEALAGLDVRPVLRGLTSVTFETTVGRLRTLFGASLEIGVQPVIATALGVVWQPFLRFARPVVEMPLTSQALGLRRYAADAIIAAMQPQPAPGVVVCAWGVDERGQLPPRWRTEILAQSAQHDTLFVCAAGNGGSHLHPADLDEVLAVGGAFQDANGDYNASDFTSSFTSSSGRHCPDIAGPSGPNPLGIYLMAPTDDVSYFDVLQHGRGLTYPDGDETAPGDSWCGLGGSSVAAAVVGAVAAIIRGAHPGLTAAGTKDILMRTAADIPFGQSADRHSPRPAGGPEPWAGGMGMVNCHAALCEALLAKIDNP